MSSFTFEPESQPFPRWMGPFSPARGTKSGFRFHQGRLGTWVSSEWGLAFWPVALSPGVRELTRLVRENWGGGRVLLLANGFVVKPLLDIEVGQRNLIGRFSGPIVLERYGLPDFDLNEPGDLRPGDRWPGPKTMGLECAIQSDGSLRCDWYHPTTWGRDAVSEQLHPPDDVLARGFRAARPGGTAGRVRVTANGHVITNRQEPDGSWASIYVGRVDAGSWTTQDSWVEE